MNILVAEPEDFSADALRILQGVDGAVVHAERTRGAALDAAFAAYDVVWVRLAERIDAARMPAQPRTKWLVCNATGIDHIDVEGLRARGVEVMSLKGEAQFLRTVRATAELSWGLLLMLQRHLLAACNDVRAHGRFARERFQGSELLGKTLGVLGVGRLGEAVCGYGHAFGMRVIGCDPRADFPVQACERVDFDELLHRSDVLSVHVDYSARTHHLLNAQAFAAMKRGAVVINTARGDVIDEAALLHALDHHLGGAALDVLSGEPHITPQHPMIAAATTRANLLISPHIGGQTVESWAKTEVFLATRVAQRMRAAAEQSR
jgi:D-3-phosphoglycerate dehydrogenase / 2-oxoglutarate reductase